MLSFSALQRCGQFEKKTSVQCEHHPMHLLCPTHHYITPALGLCVHAYHIPTMFGKACNTPGVHHKPGYSCCHLGLGVNGRFKGLLQLKTSGWDASCSTHCIGHFRLATLNSTFRLNALMRAALLSFIMLFASAANKGSGF